MNTRPIRALLRHAAVLAALGPATPAADTEPKEIPEPPLKTPMGNLPGVNALPVLREMPDMLTMDNGRRVTTVAQWPQRRQEILRTLDGSWAFRNTRFLPAYPGFDWGLLRSWAWGVSRIVEYLETDPSIDKGKLIVTGASRTGKSAMVAAAVGDYLPAA